MLDRRRTGSGSGGPRDGRTVCIALLCKYLDVTEPSSGEPVPSGADADVRDDGTAVDGVELGYLPAGYL
jgi:hypothetical protein